MEYDFNPIRCVFSIPSPRIGDRKYNSLDKNYILSQIMRDPIY